MFCKKCGVKAKRNDLICRECGEPISWEAKKGSIIQSGRTLSGWYGGPAFADPNKSFRIYNGPRVRTRVRPLVSLRFIIGVVLILAFVLVVCVLVLPKLGDGGSERGLESARGNGGNNVIDAPPVSSGSGGAESTASSASNSGLAGPVQVVEPRFNKAEASSSLLSSQDGVSHGPQNAIDGDTLTAWSGGSSGNGKGEWLRVLAKEPQKVRGVSVLAGSPRTRGAYSKNSRPCEVTIVLSDGYAQKVRLEDLYSEWQSITFDKEHVTTSVTIVVDSVYEGSALSDVSFTEVKVL